MRNFHRNVLLSVSLLSVLGFFFINAAPVIKISDWVKTGGYYHIESRSQSGVIGSAGRGKLSHEKMNWGYNQKGQFQYWWSQIWQLIDVPGSPGYVMFKNRYTHQCLESIQQNNDRLTTQECKPQFHSIHFKLKNLNPHESLFLIQSRHSGLCLQAENGKLTSRPCNTQYWDQHWWITQASADVKSNLSEFNQINYSFARPEAEGWISEMHGPVTGSQRWLFSATNETDTFMPYEAGSHGSSLSSLRSKEKTNTTWKFGISLRTEPMANGGQATMALDKINYPDYRDAYTAAFITDNYDVNGNTPRPKMSDNLVIEFQVALKAFENVDDGTTASGKTRLLTGITLTDETGYVYYFEVNLVKTQNFDLCLTYKNLSYGLGRDENCDPYGVFDRRSQFGSGELLYVNGPGLGALGLQPTPNLFESSNFRNVRIPLSDWFNKTPWLKKPKDLSKVTVSGVYIGPEIWGKGRLWFDIKRYRLYREE